MNFLLNLKGMHIAYLLLYTIWAKTLSKYSFENNEVFYLSPDQLVKCSFTNISEPICFVWLDNTRSHRLTKHAEDRRTYNFKQREELETQDLSTFVKIIYSKPHLYFSNEDPIRVAAIIYTMITSPESQNIFFSNFNNFLFHYFSSPFKWL